MSDVDLFKSKESQSTLEKMLHEENQIFGFDAANLYQNNERGFGQKYETPMNFGSSYEQQNKDYNKYLYSVSGLQFKINLVQNSYKGEKSANSRSEMET